jgi:translation initiation factor 2 alpha subunit (eIF-2alpha)
MNNFFQIYSNQYPEINELVVIKFTKKNDSHFEGELIEYNFSAIMSYNDATKKKKVYSWNKIVPLNKVLLAKIEDINITSNCVQVSIAYNEVNFKEKMTPFQDNKILMSIIKKITYITKIDFNDFWHNIIYSIDIKRKENYEDNLFVFFKNNLELVKELIIKYYENNKEIIDTLENNLVTPNQKITSKIGLISLGGIANTKKILNDFIQDQLLNSPKDQLWNFTFKYDTTPYYILESYTEDSSLDNHTKFIETLNLLATKNNIFSKIEYIGKI